LLSKEQRNHKISAKSNINVGRRQQPPRLSLFEIADTPRLTPSSDAPQNARRRAHSVDVRARRCGDADVNRLAASVHNVTARTHAPALHEDQKFIL
jgi:hypothetical protein